MIKTTNKSTVAFTILVLILFLGYLEPNCVVGLSGYAGATWKYLHFAFLGLRILSIVIAILVFIKKPKVDILFCMSGIIMLYLIMGDVINNNAEILKTVFWAGSCISAIIIISYLQSIGKLDDALRIICFVLGTYIIINYVLLVLKPDGVYHSFIYNRTQTGGVGHFLGYKNTHIYYFIPYIFIRYYLVSKKERRIKTAYVIMLLVIFHSSILAKASTTTIFSAIIIAFCLLPKLLNKIHGELIVTASIVISFVLIMSDSLFDIVQIVSGLFDKTTSLSGRTVVWKQGVQTFWEHPLFGTGMAHIPDNINYQQYHNKYLDYLCVGGMFLLVLFTILLAIIAKKSNDESFWKKNAVVIALFSYCLLYIVEASRTDLYFWIVISICYYSCSVSEKNTEYIANKD